jgi:hypothetical protein
MSARKLFLHIGPAKTGTSAVQHALRGYEGEDLNYPKVGLWADGSHHNLVFNYFGQFIRPEFERGDVREWFRRISEQVAGNRGHLLISSEALAGHDLRPFAADLLACLDPSDGWEVEVLVTCRDHYERASSAYNQKIKDGFRMERSLPDEYLGQRAAHLCYSPMLKRLQSSGLDVRVLNYHPREDFLYRFLSHIGLDRPESIRNERRNVSLSVKGLVATLAANLVAASAQDRARYFAELKRIRPFFAASGPIFGRQATMEAEVHFRADRERLSREFGVEMPAPDLEHAEGRFSIDQAQWREIAAVVAGLGEEGAAIAQAAGRFIREGQA